MIYAFIPARSGSTRLPNKNIKELKGKPLVWWTLLAAEKSTRVDKIVFSSNSQEYIDLVLELTQSFSKEIIFDNRSVEHAQIKYLHPNGSINCLPISLLRLVSHGAGRQQLNQHIVFRKSEFLQKFSLEVIKDFTFRLRMLHGAIIENDLFGKRLGQLQYKIDVFLAIRTENNLINPSAFFGGEQGPPYQRLPL